MFGLLLFHALVRVSVQIIYVKLSVVMGLGWLLGFVAAFVDWSGLWYIFIVVNSLQGAMLCVAFVVTRQVISDMFRIQHVFYIVF